MLKQLRYFFTLMLLAVASVGWAGDITFTPSDFEATSNADYSLTKSGVTVAVAGSTVTTDDIRIYANKTITISSTTAKIKKIVFTCSGTDNNKYGPGLFAEKEGYSYEGKIGTWTGETNEITFTTTAQVRATEIVVTIDGDVTPDPISVNPPTFNPNGGEVEAGTQVQIAFDGALLYYTTDGSEPSMSNDNAVEVSTSPATITINEGVTIKAVAYDEDDNPSDPVSATFTVKQTSEEGADVIFDATKDIATTGETAGAWSITKSGITISSNGGIGGNGTEYRIYKNNTFTISSTNGNIVQIIFEATSGNPTTGFGNVEGFNSDKTIWTGNAESVSFVASEKQVRLTKITVVLEGGDVTPTKTPAGLEYEITSFTIDPSEGFTAPTLKNPYTLTVKYSSDNPDVAEVDAQTGKVTIGEEGTATITASFDGDDVYEAGSASYTIIVKAASQPGEYETVSVPYSVNFKEGQDKFKIEDATLVEGLNFVWAQSSSYGMKASAYVSGTNYDAESWLVSPIVDLSANTGNANLTFKHAVNYFSSIDKAKEEATVWVREEGGQWTQLEISYPDKLGWTFVEGGVIDLSSYNGKKIQIGFKYVSTATKSGTWEIENFSIITEEVVEKLEAGLSYDVANFTATIDETTEFPVLNNPNNLDITYSSTNESVATVDDTTGEITLVGPGQTTIKATFEGNDEYNEGSASYLLVVKEPEIAGTDKFELVTDANTLADGDVIILAFVDEENKVWALSTTQNDNNRAANKTTLNEDGTITPGSSIQQITLEDGYYFNVGDGYLYAASSSGNQMKTEANADDNAKATIAIGNDGGATIIFQGSNTRNHMRFNANNGNPIFSCYADNSSVKTLPRIYRKVAEVEGETIPVTISSAEWATLYYSDKAFEIPEGVIANIVIAIDDNDVIQLEALNGIIPAGTAVALNGPQGTYDFKVVNDETVAPANNLLRGFDIPHLTEGGDIYYKLTVMNNKVGFYWGEENGDAFETGAHKAYLAIYADASNAKFFVLGTAGDLVSEDGGFVDGINEVTASDSKKEYFNLNGTRVNSLRKGIYIVGGKKVVIK